MLQRIQRGTAATISATFYVDGAPADPLPDTATVAVLREDGTTLIASGAATEAGVGRFTKTLTAAQTADCDVLTATWTATLGGQSQSIQTQIEIVGAPLCSIDEVEQALPSGLTASVDKIRDARTTAEVWLEDACGVAFRPRYAREKLDGPGSTDLLLSHPRPLVLRAVTVADTALAVDEIAELEADDAGVVYRASGWTEGRRNVEVKYDHGHKIVPAPVNRAAIKLTRLFLTPDPSNRDERATRIETDEASYSLVTPGVRGAITSIPEVNAVLMQYGYVDGVA